MASTMSDRCLHHFIGDSPLTNCERGPHCQDAGLSAIFL